MDKRINDDSREQLEADLLALTVRWHDYDGNFMKLYSSVAYAQVKELLDRQAAITTREWDSATANRRIDELQAKLDAYDETHMLLPVDADGVPIHVGDMIQQLNHAGVWTDAMPVVAVDENGCFALAQGYACEARTYVWGNNCRHVKPRTIEDVLREMLDRNSDGIGLREFNRDFNAFVEHYAAEIREADWE